MRCALSGYCFKGNCTGRAVLIFASPFFVCKGSGAQKGAVFSFPHFFWHMGSRAVFSFWAVHKRAVWHWDGKRHWYEDDSSQELWQDLVQGAFCSNAVLVFYKKKKVITSKLKVRGTYLRYLRKEALPKFASWLSAEADGLTWASPFCSSSFPSELTPRTPLSAAFPSGGKPPS